jgi:HD-like signal output (HDOD) protein
MSARDVADLHDRLSRKLGDSSLPTLPEVALRIMDLVGNERSTIDQFAEVIQSDQALTGRLLRLANSAHYAQRKPVTTLNRAMVLIGMDRLKAMALGFHLSKAAAADDSAFGFKRQWTISLFRAWLALRLAERFEKSVSGEAFIVGLMSDAGVPMMPRLAGEKYLELVTPDMPPALRLKSEFEHFEFTHVDVAAVLCRIWKFPVVLAKPICLHHSPARQIQRTERGYDHASLLHAIAYFVGSLPLSPENSDLPASIAEAGFATLADNLFGMTMPEMGETLADAAKDFSATRDMFAHIVDRRVSVDAILRKANHYLGDSVEDLCEESMENERLLGRVLRFEAGGLTLEMERTVDHIVTVYINDAAGKRLLSEEINISLQDETEIRQLLLLDEASDDELREVFNGLHHLAA